jgi:hypothetical protein
MFFLSTLGADGCPTVSYKGGAPGFVKVDAGDLVFPCYDGNGMFYSMGNLARFPQVGLLFIDFEKPHRLRVEGTAVIGEGDALLAAYPGALFLVRVTPAHTFVRRTFSTGRSRVDPGPGHDDLCNSAAISMSLGDKVPKVSIIAPAPPG